MFRYEKVAGKVYLVFWYESYNEQYEMDMLEENCIDNLVKFERWCVNGEYEYRYDITNKYNLNVMIKSRKLLFEDVKRIFTALFETIDFLMDFLMEPDSLMLDAEFIYISDTEVEFIFNYEERENFYDTVTGFIKYVLNKLDYSDSKAVELSYKMFDAVTVRKEDIGYLAELFTTYMKEINKENVNESSSLKKAAFLTDTYIDNQNYCEINNQTEILYNNESVNRRTELKKCTALDNRNSEKVKTIKSKITVIIAVIIMIFTLFKIFR